jgi:hypothetical protein
VTTFAQDIHAAGGWNEFLKDYAADRLKTVTDPDPVVPTSLWPIGTRLALDGEDGPWRLIEIAGMFDHGPDAGGWATVVRPVAMEPGHDCSPRNVDPETLVALGYVVAEEAPAAPEAWATDPAEVARSPLDREDRA